MFGVRVEGPSALRSLQQKIPRAADRATSRLTASYSPSQTPSSSAPSRDKRGNPPAPAPDSAPPTAWKCDTDERGPGPGPVFSLAPPPVADNAGVAVGVVVGGGQGRDLGQGRCRIVGGALGWVGRRVGGGVRRWRLWTLGGGRWAGWRRCCWIGGGNFSWGTG